MKKNRVFFIFKITVLCLFLIAVGAACHFEKTPSAAESSFYYWKQTFRLSDLERSYLKGLAVQKIYVKYFDVVWNNVTQSPKNVAIVHFKDLPPADIAITPTVFITNETIKQSSPDSIEVLANKIYDVIVQISNQYNISPASEIQIDCDWTLSTRDKYFAFLTALKAKHPAHNLSATIRLHQVKFYKKTGVPPVNRGTLMFYNMGDVSNPTMTNSILDLTIAKQYMVNFEAYKLPLDVGLPIFRWGVLSRRGRVVKLINQLDFEDLENLEKYAPVSVNEFEVLNSHYLSGHYLYKGDKIRIEHVSTAQLRSAALLLQAELKNNHTIVTYYHLDSITLPYYALDSLKLVTGLF